MTKINWRCTGLLTHLGCGVGFASPENCRGHGNRINPDDVCMHLSPSCSRHSRPKREAYVCNSSDGCVRGIEYPNPKNCYLRVPIPGPCGCLQKIKIRGRIRRYQCTNDDDCTQWDLISEPSPQECGDCKCLKEIIAKARPTGESTEDKPKTGSSGQQNRGDSTEPFFCPKHREDARGAEISLISWLIPQASTTEMLSFTSTLSKRDATLCVCRVIEPSLQVKCCVLDADGKVIMYLPLLPGRFVGTVSPPKKGNDSSSTKNIESGNLPGDNDPHIGNVTRERL